MLSFRIGKKRRILTTVILVSLYVCSQVVLYKNPPTEKKVFLKTFPNTKVFTKDVSNVLVNLTTRLKKSWKSNSFAQKLFGNSSSHFPIVVYNRLPKCASTLTRVVMAKLHSKNPDRFNLKIENYPRIKQVLSVDEQKELVKKWSSYTSPTVFIRHVRFVDFKQFGFPEPIYINVVRDPVEQFISAYFFNRFGFVGWNDDKVRKWLSVKPDEDRFMSLETCVMKNVTRCVEQNPSRYFSYFCGHESRCNDKDRWSMEKAKRVVEEKYGVVGIAEKYEETLLLLENYLPSFFKNITTTYITAKQKGQLPLTKTARKINPSEQIKDKLRKALHLRVEFYDFIKLRFEKQLMSSQSGHAFD